MEPKKSVNKKPIVITAAIAAVMCIVAVVVIFSVGSGTEKRLAEQLDLADRYLSELDYESAIAAYEAAIEIDPKCEEAYLGLADIYIEQGEYEKAAEILEAGLAQIDSEAIRKKLEEVEVLMAERERPVEEEVESEEANCLSLGNRYLEEQDYEQAIAYFEEAIRINPKNVDAYLGIVEVYIRTGQYELALEYAQKGYDATGDERLAEKIEMLQNGNITRSDGLVMMMTCYDDAGEIMYRHEYTYNQENIQDSISHYDKSGNLIKTLSISDNGQEREGYGYFIETGELFRISVTYEDNLITALHYDDDDVTVISWEITELDDNGNSVRSIRGLGNKVGNEDDIDTFEEYSYDENGNLIMTLRYDANYQLQDKQVWERDEQGHIQRYVAYDKNENIIWYYSYEYDKDGKMISEKQYDGADNLLYERVYE